MSWSKWRLLAGLAVPLCVALVAAGRAPEPPLFTEIGTTSERSESRQERRDRVNEDSTREAARDPDGRSDAVITFDSPLDVQQAEEILARLRDSQLAGLYTLVASQPNPQVGRCGMRSPTENLSETLDYCVGLKKAHYEHKLGFYKELRANPPSGYDLGAIDSSETEIRESLELIEAGTVIFGLVVNARQDHLAELVRQPRHEFVYSVEMFSDRKEVTPIWPE